MSETYRGSLKLPPDLEPKVREALEDHDRIIKRGIPTYDPGPGGGGGSIIPPGVPGTPTRYIKWKTGGTLSRISPSPSGVVAVLQFENTPVVKNGTQNLDLVEDFYPNIGDTLTLISDGLRWHELSRSTAGAGIVIRPPSSAAIINLIFSIAAEGSTVTFLPGTYELNNTLVVAKALHLNGYGATLDWGTTVLATDANWYEIPRTTASSYTPTDREAAAKSVGNGFIIGNTSEAIFGPTMNGFTLTRGGSSLGAASTDRAATGLRLGRVVEGSFRDLTVDNFENGVLLGGSEDGGTAHNEFHNFVTGDCRYSITFSTSGSAGYANQNTFYGGRLQVNSGPRADASWPDDWELVRLIEDSGATSAPPNNNQFIGLSMERAANRKLRLEGSDNTFIGCRWENVNASSDITIGNEGSGSTVWRRNFFLNGFDLDKIVYNEKIEYLDSGLGINNSNTFITGGNSEFAGAAEAGSTRLNLAAFRFQHSNSNKPALGVATFEATPYESLGLRATVGTQGQTPSAQTGDNSLGGITFHESGTPETIRNYLALDTVSPWDINVLGGLNIAKLLLIRDTNPDINFQTTEATGTAAFVGTKTGIAPLTARNGSGSEPSFIVQDSGSQIRMRHVANSGLTGAGGGSIEWYTGAAGAESLSNALFLNNSGNNLRVTNGLDVEEELRVYHADYTGYATITADTDGRVFFDSSRSTKSIYFNSANTSNGLLLYTDTSGDNNFYCTSGDPDLNVILGQSGGEFRVQDSLFGTKWAIQPDNSTPRMICIDIEGAFTFLNEATTNTVKNTLTIQRGTTGTAAAGIGASMTFTLENDAGTYNAAALWETTLTNTAAASPDARTRMQVLGSGSYVDSGDLFVLDGATEAVGIGRVPTTYKLEVAGDGQFDTGLIVNDTANSAGDFRVEGTSSTHALFVDASANAVGIGLSDPDAALGLNVSLDVSGGTHFNSNQTDVSTIFSSQNQTYMLVFDSAADAIGILTNTPALELDVNGAFGTRYANVNFSTDQASVATSGDSNLRLNNSSGSSKYIGGFGNGVNGKFLYLHCTSASVELLDEGDANASSTAANRMRFAGGANITLAQDESITLQYDSADSRWRTCGAKG